MITCGIDEAGRGPMIGPMVISGVAVDEQGGEKLKHLGVKDSKLLSSKRRERLAEEIKKITKEIHSITIPAKEIDDAVESKTTNLNWLEADKTALIINRLKPDKVFIDCPSPNINAYRNYILEKLENKKVQLVVEHKADVKYIEASAASIISKVLRDKEIEKIKAQIKMDFGSGYPADERTIKFAQDHWKSHHNIFRKSWASYKKIADEKQSSLSKF